MPSFFQYFHARCPTSLSCCRAALVAACLLVAGAPQGTAQEVSVVLAPVQEQTVTSTGDFVGTVLPVRRSIIGSAVDGRVSALKVDAGQKVAKGDVLAELLDDTINIELAGARAELALRQAELDELVNGALPEEIAQAEAQLRAAEALEAYTRSRLTRTQQLAEASGAISEEELELARSEFLSTEQSRIEAQESLALLRQGPRRERIAQAQANLAIQTEAVALLEDEKEKHLLRSPFEGYVVREYTEEGAWVQPGDPIAEVIDIDPVEIEVNVPERSVRFLQRGMPLMVRLDAFPGSQFKGTVSRIIPEADTRARTFPVRIHVPNAPADERELLRPGMLARVELPTSGSVTALTVPKDAVIFGGPKPVVWKNNNNTAQPVIVEVGAASGKSLVVRGDLKPGDQVVIRGNEGLRPGQPIRPTAPIE